MNIPSNFNHYVAGDMPKILEEYKKFSKSIFPQILNTYEWDKYPEQIDLKQCIQCATYPEEYLKDETCKIFILSSRSDGMKIMVPGPNSEWDSIYHLMYLGYYAIKETKLYHLNYNTKPDNILEIILNGYDQIKIMGLAAGIRKKLPSQFRRELNDIVHCLEENKDIYHRDDEYKGEWTDEMLHKSREKMVQIIKKSPGIRSLLNEKEDMDRRYEIDILHEMNNTLEKMHSFNEKKLHKIEMEIKKAGGHAEYVQKNEVGYAINGLENATKAGLYDELVDKKDNGWGITWKQRRILGIEKLKNKYESMFKEKVRNIFENENQELRIINIRK